MFHESLAAIPIKPADLIALGLPRSTAYDWCSGSSTPDHPAFVLALLQHAKPTQGNKTVIRTNASRSSIKAKRKR